VACWAESRCNYARGDKEEEHSALALVDAESGMDAGAGLEGEGAPNGREVRRLGASCPSQIV
jgi:hypothetical protein